MERNNSGVEIKNAIRDQISFITNSCVLYDKGCEEEAIRIAASLNVLLETRKNGSKGLLRVLPIDFKLLSTVPDVEDVDLSKLIISKIKLNTDLKVELNKHQANINENKSFLLIYIEQEDKWFIYGITQAGVELKCFLEELNVQLDMSDKIFLIYYWMRRFSDKENNVKDAGKKIIIRHLSALFGYHNQYVPGFYFPMIKTDSLGNDVPQLTHVNEKHMSLDSWLDEIIYSIPDESRQDHILTRRELIDSARDQDGGGHFDLKLDVMAYYKSKYGEKIAELDGRDITTKNYHLIMLRQIGYEIMNSCILNLLDETICD